MAQKLCPRWTKDALGYVNYDSYHPENGQQAYALRDADPTSLPTSADSNSTKWVTSSDGSASSNKPTRGTGLGTAIEQVTRQQYDDQGCVTLRATEDGTDGTILARHYTAYETNRTLQFPYWDTSTNKPLLPIQVSAFDDGVMVTEQYAVDPARTAQSGGVPTGLSSGTNQSHYLRWTRRTYDAAGRVNKTISNDTDGDPSTGTSDQDVTVEMDYNSDGKLTTLTAENPTTGDQVTKYVHGTSRGGITPKVYRKDLLRAEIYPDSDDTTTFGNGSDGTYDRIEYTYNIAGQRLTRKDQLGTVHTYEYDQAGRDHLRYPGPAGKDHHVRQRDGRQRQRGQPGGSHLHRPGSAGKGIPGARRGQGCQHFVRPAYL